MANWTSPTNETFLPDLVEDIKARDVDTARMFDSGVFSNIPENSIRFNVDEGVMQRWESGNWVDRQFSLDALPNINSTTGVFGSNIQIPRITVNNKGLITNVLAQNIRAASTSQTGVIQLNDSITSTSTTQAATPNAVRQANLRNQPQTLSGSTTNQMSETGHSHALTIASDNDAETGSGNGLVTPPKVKIHVDNRLSDDIEDDSSELIASSKLVNDLANSKVDGSVIGQIVTRNWVNASAPSNISFQAISWSPKLGIFVSVGSGIGTSSSDPDRIAVSTDGLSWSVVTAPSASWTDVVWSPELEIFVAVAQSGSRIATSIDGINWISRSAPQNNDWKSVTWSPDLNLFVAVAISGTQRIMYSSNGASWTGVVAPSQRPWDGVVWSDELEIFVAVATNTFLGLDTVMTSSDGENWVSYEGATGRRLYWIPELKILIALGSTSTIRVSDDALNWTVINQSGGRWRYLAWSSELKKLVAVSQTNAVVAVSEDGYNWTNVPLPVDEFWGTIGWSSELSLFTILVSSTATTRSLRSL